MNFKKVPPPTQPPLTVRENIYYLRVVGWGWNFFFKFTKGGVILLNIFMLLKDVGKKISYEYGIPPFVNFKKSSTPHPTTLNTLPKKKHILPKKGGWMTTT